MNCSPPGSSVHGIPQARCWNELPSPSPGELPLPRDQTQISCTASRFFIIWANRKAMTLLEIWNSSGIMIHLLWRKFHKPQSQSGNFSSVQFSRSVVSDSLWPHESQHTRPPCPSQTPVYSNPYPLSWWYHPALSSSVIPFSSCPQSFPASRSFQMSQPFASDGQNIGVSASTSVFPMNAQDWSPLDGLIGSPCSPILTCHLCIFFVDMSLHVFCPHSSWTFFFFFLLLCLTVLYVF